GTVSVRAMGCRRTTREEPEGAPRTGRGGWAPPWPAAWATGRPPLIEPVLLGYGQGYGPCPYPNGRRRVRFWADDQDRPSRKAAARSRASSRTGFSEWPRRGYVTSSASRSEGTRARRSSSRANGSASPDSS